ncbi:MAG: DUF4421 domain-containing protein [Spirochaetales bacterium]|nr:DUF4421 domain-containing protein [Spirochaetales bacterium]
MLAHPRQVDRHGKLRLIVFAFSCAAAIAPLRAVEEDVPPLGIRFGLGTGLQNVNFSLDEEGLGTGNLTATPNTPLHLILGVSWRSIAVGARLNLPGSIEESESRGETDFTNVQLQFYGPRYALDISYQEHEGMYIDNSSDFDVAIDDTRIPDLSAQTIAAAFFWSRNPRVNLATAYKLDTIPERSRIGLIWMGSVSRITISAPSGPGRGIPALDGTKWSESMDIRTHTAIGGFGFTTMLTRSSLFFAPMITIGLGLQLSDFDVADGGGTEWSIVPQLSGRLSVGYNNRTWYLAGLANIDARNVQTPFLEATQGSVLIEIVFGRRYTFGGRLPWRDRSPEG